MDRKKLLTLTDLVSWIVDDLTSADTKKSEFMEKYNRLKVGDHLRYLLSGYPELISKLKQAENQLSMNDMIHEWNDLHVSILRLIPTTANIPMVYTTVCITVTLYPIEKTDAVKAILAATKYVMSFHWQDETLHIIVSYADAPIDLSRDDIFETIEVDLKEKLSHR